jgi:hypothetical protein
MSARKRIIESESESEPDNASRVVSSSSMLSTSAIRVSKPTPTVVHSTRSKDDDNFRRLPTQRAKERLDRLNAMAVRYIVRCDSYIA